MHECNCEFNYIGDLEELSELEDLTDEFFDEAEAFEEYYARDAENFLLNILEDFEEFKEIKTNLTDEFNERLADTAINDFGCDSDCVYACTNLTYTSFT